jgi:tetratricopeptide (TPR) repeat protein
MKPISSRGRRLIAGALVLVLPLAALARSAKKGKEANAAVPSGAPTTFAPMPPDHELASIWNDPDFTRRLLGSYGFAADVEPRLTPEEQALYRDKIVPLLREDPRKAIPALEAALKPTASALFDFTLGNVYFQHEDLTNAVKYFTAALAKFPDYRRAQKNLAFALVRAGQYAEAIGPLTRTITLGGGDGKVFGLLGFCYASQGRYASAEGAYRQALVFEPENFEFQLGLVKCAVATANFDPALALLEEMIAGHPEREALWTLQANLYIQKEQPAQAAISLEMLRRLGRQTPSSLFLLGDLYLAQEARDLALGAYLEALERDGGQLHAAKALRAADMLVSRGAPEEARRLFAAIRAHTTLSGADELKLLRLEAKVALATGDSDAAIRTLEDLLQQDPLDGEALLLAGDYYARHDQIEKAQFRYDAASKLQGFEADAYVKQAQLFIRLRQYAPAIELLRKAQKLKPRDNVQRYLEQVEQVARNARS